MKKLLKFKKLVIVVLLFGTLFSCNDDENIPSGEGAVSIKLTDAPFPFEFVTKANVGIAKVELKNSSGEYVVVFEGNSSYNMVNLTNGTTKTVGNSNIKKGTYNNARITLNAASVELSNGKSFSMNSEAQGSYTVSISPALVVEEGNTSNILFDLNVNNSYQFKGTWFGSWIPNIASITGCTFDADFRVCDLDQTGSIEGTVKVSGSHKKNVYVYVNVNGHKITTHTKADGSFKFIGIKEGNYTVTAESESGDTGSVSNIKVEGTGTATCTLDL